MGPEPVRLCFWEETPPGSTALLSAEASLLPVKPNTHPGLAGRKHSTAWPSLGTGPHHLAQAGCRLLNQSVHRLSLCRWSLSTALTCNTSLSLCGLFCNFTGASGALLSLSNTILCVSVLNKTRGFILILKTLPSAPSLLSADEVTSTDQEGSASGGITWPASTPLLHRASALRTAVLLPMTRGEGMGPCSPWTGC